MSSYAMTSANNPLALLPAAAANHQQSFLGAPGAAGGHHQSAAATAAANPNALAAAAAAGNPASSLVNFSSLLNQKDSRWLQLEVCREFQRNKCSRPDVECKFAHPGPSIEIQSGKVTACYDSIKGRCNRDKPPCKYFHPPQHLKDQLLINGRNHLALKNALMQQVSLNTPAIIPSHTPSMVSQPWVVGPSAMSPICGYSFPIGYLGNNPTTAGLGPFGYSACDNQAAAAALGLVGGGLNEASGNPSAAAAFGTGLTGHQQAVAAAQVAASLRLGSAMSASNHLGMRHSAQTQQHTSIQQASSWNQNGVPLIRPRSDRVEVCREFRRGFCNRSVNECRYAHPVDGVSIAEDGSVIICMDHEKGRCARDPCRYFHRPDHMKTTAGAATVAGATNSSKAGGGPGNCSIVTNTFINQPVYTQQISATTGAPAAGFSPAAAAAAAAGDLAAANARTAAQQQAAAAANAAAAAGAAALANASLLA